MGSNTDNAVDLIEYAMGNDADFYPDGTAKAIKAGSLFRFTPHYHPWGKETHDRQKVGIKFYPKGVVPKLIVTSHRIRTGVGNDWVFNRERVEDLLLRAGHQLDFDEPRMPTGNLIDDNPLNGVAVEYSSKHRRAARAVLPASEAGADRQLPAAHALPGLADAARSDSPRWPPGSAH